jgi:toxin FitB
MMYLLDTNVISEFRRAQRGKAHPNVIYWANSVPEESMFLSAISILELEIGALQMERRDKVQGAMLRLWMEKSVLPVFSNRILPLDYFIAMQCAALHVLNPQSERDAMIAATALVHGMTIVTRNISDFESTGVTVFNPWQA